ncbi:beta-ketoacyl-ACP synthase II [bacterium AH-315-J19]|nr:beta-ketoacyl-ACP synthase II [Robiginitomaculum sp.]MBN4058434.1 beta-ketoacyl-ACP synthase II [bacterium AH-315-J19]
MAGRRVVVTGLGLVTPLGCGVDTAWSNVLANKSGASRIEHFQADDLGCEIAAMVPRLDGRGGGGADIAGTFDPDAFLTKREQNRIDEFIVFGIVAAEEAIKDSGWVIDPEDTETQERTGVIFGSGLGGLQTIYESSLKLAEKGPRRFGPFVLPGMLTNLTSGHISIRHGYKGANHSVVTACATGAHAIGDAARMIERGDVDVMIAGGSEATICRIGITSFVACRAMTTGFNDKPETASRPYDKDRDGFLMGEGAGAVVLEEYEHAKARGATIYAELKGYGLTGDAYHITSPAPDGSGGYRAMKMALNDAGMTVDEIGYVNAHGTSTPMGDEVELKAVERLFGDAASNLSMSSTKSATGHLLGAAGAVEAIFSILAVRDNMVPPTLNLHNPSVETPIDLVPLKAKKKSLKAVMSNSFGFGGTNASLIFAELPKND